MPHDTETSNDILEVSVLRILLHTVLLEVCDLTRQTDIEDKRQAVQRRVGSRVEIVDLVMLMEA